MSRLNVVALVSGGKDSFFSMLHCLEHGHTIVALANLYPQCSDGTIVEDSDSFMYQTIGHAVIPLYEKALGLPLYRQAIEGHAVSQTKTYDPSASKTHEDETEALVPLLRRVLRSHPEVNAVSTGAILSDYQRTRVESVALRLGLTPISYLWQYPRIVTRSPVALLEDMAAAGQDSRIIKVSSGGLDSSFLWQNVADNRTQQRLLKASQRFGGAEDGAALGEGGEFETLSISGPAPLWKHRIIVDDCNRPIVPGEAGSAALRLIDPRLEPHYDIVDAPLAQPPLLSEHFQSVLTQLVNIGRSDVPQSTQDKATCTAEHVLESPDTQTLLIRAQTGEGVDAASQMRSIMVAIGRLLMTNGHDMTDVAYTSIVLRDMADFPKINSVYSTCFTRPNPPARATIACAAVLDVGQHLMMSVTSVKAAPERREALHVQSISYWAPANIGPYSQAITVPTKVAKIESTVTYIAGQIPLIPATMQLDGMTAESKHQGFLYQAVLSLQHLHRIALAVRVQMWKHVIAFIVAPDDASAREQAAIVREVWTTTYDQATYVVPEDEDEDEHFDVWHDRYGSNRPLYNAQAGSNPNAGVDLFTQQSPALVVIQVDSLPRAASVEWVAFGASRPTGSELFHYRHLLDVFAGKLL